MTALSSTTRLLYGRPVAPLASPAAREGGVAGPAAASRPRRILVVEDEAVVAMLVEGMLLDLGCETIETAGSLDDALDRARTGAFDLAVLDVNLGGALSYPVAETLRRRGIAFVFATGYGAGHVDGAYADVPTIRKPFDADDLAAAIAQALSGD